ncbi:MAG: hypothetical protein ABFR90_07635 [Planctomycetota bacterium]
MKEKENKDWFNCRVFLTLSLAGLLFNVGFFVYLKKNHIFEYEYEFAKHLTLIFFVAFVILPLAVCVFILFYEKAIYRLLCHRHKRRIEKYGLEKILREQRINKAISSFMISFIFSLVCSINLFVLLILGIGNLSAPKFDEIPAMLFLVIITVPILLISFICSVVCIRFFVSKKGKTKALKYAIQLKKKPRFFGTIWLKACGFNQQDIQIYLKKLNL